MSVLAKPVYNEKSAFLNIFVKFIMKLGSILGEMATFKMSYIREEMASLEDERIHTSMQEIISFTNDVEKSQDSFKADK